MPQYHVFTCDGEFGARDYVDTEFGESPEEAVALAAADDPGHYVAFEAVGTLSDMVWYPENGRPCLRENYSETELHQVTVK